MDSLAMLKSKKRMNKLDHEGKENQRIQENGGRGRKKRGKGQKL